MIGSIRKHSTWMWWAIIVITIFTFVYWGSSRYDNGRGGGGNYGSMDGERITQDEINNANGEIRLRYFFKYGTWPDRDGQRTGFDEQRELAEWLFIVRKQKEYNVSIDPDTVGLAAKNVLRNFENQAHVSSDTLAQQYADDLERYIRHELGREQLFSIIGLSGQLVTPQEARSLYEREYQEIASKAVFFSASNYLAGVPAPGPEAVSGFYTTNMAAYRLPDRVQVSYVAFDVSNQLARVEHEFTNLNEVVEATMNRFGTNIARFGKTPDEARARIRKELIHEKAMAETRTKADAFAAELFDMNPVQAGNLATLAKAKGLNARVSRPFDEEYGPADFDGGPNFAKVAFSLTAEEPFASQPILSENTVYVVALDKKIPSEIPPLSQIRDQVTSDFKNHQAVLRAHQAGEEFAQVARTGLSLGKNFASLCADAHVKPVSVPDFSLSTRELPAVEDYLTLNQFKQIAFSTSPGSVSHFNPTRDGGLVVYVERLLPIDPSRMSADLPAFLNSVRRARQMEAVNAWAMVEEPKSLRSTYWGRQRQSGANGEAEP
jgi:hypothetical protein